jgi:hypothetical protein
MSPGTFCHGPAGTGGTPVEIIGICGPEKTPPWGLMGCWAGLGLTIIGWFKAAAPSWDKP